MSEAPDYARKLMGVRKWHVRGDRLHSTGVTRHDLWQPNATRKAACLVMQGRTAKAVLERDDFHFAPHEDCVCGLYAWVGLDICNKHFPTPRPSYVKEDDPYIAGVVSARGEVIYAGYGFRAEYMSIEALIIGKECIGFLGQEISLMPAYRRLAKLYDVPLIYNPEVMPFMKDMGVVLDAYAPEEEEPEEKPPSLKMTPSALGIFTAGMSIQAGAQLTYDPITSTVRHCGPSDIPLGVARGRSKRGNEDIKAGEQVVVDPLPPNLQKPYFTSMKPVDIEEKHARTALSVAGWAGLIGMVVMAYAVVRNVGGMYLLWFVFEIICGAGFLLAYKWLTEEER